MKHSLRLVSFAKQLAVPVAIMYLGTAQQSSPVNALSVQSPTKEEVSDKVAGHLERGDALLRYKQYDQAIAQYNRALAESGKPVFTIYLNLGSAYYQKGDYSLAIDAYTKATEVKPNDWRAHYNLAEALFASEDYPGAESKYRKVISLNPDSFTRAKTHHFLGLALFKQNKVDEALVEYRIAIELRSGRYAEARYNLAVALLEQKQYQAAERELRVAIELERSFAEAHLNLGASLEHQKRYQEAVQAYLVYLQLAPSAPDAEKMRRHIEILTTMK